ncbi:MAG: FecR family protein [Burkholderiales bacterium]
MRVHGFLAFVVGIAAFAAIGPSFAQTVQGFVQEVSGNVTAQVGTRSPQSVGRGQTLVSNAIIATGPGSYAALKFEDGTAVLLKENTSFQVQSYTYNPKAPENASAIFNLVRGGLRMITGLVTSRNRDALKVATPLATIGIRGTEFIAELVNPLYVQVVNGVVTVTNAAGTVVFSAGQAALVANPSALGNLVPLNQVPPGVFQMPNFPLTAVPEAVPPGSPVGGTVTAGGAGAAAAAIGAAAAAGVLMSTESETTTTHH